MARMLERSAELEVLNGIDEAFWPRIRRLVIEVHDIGQRLKQVVNWLRELGYRADCSQAPLFVGGSVHMVVATRD